MVRANGGYKGVTLLTTLACIDAGLILREADIRLDDYTERQKHQQHGDLHVAKKIREAGHVGKSTEAGEDTTQGNSYAELLRVNSTVNR